ncbi:MAG TPA: helix-turn-helix domain-containing protein [Patescibacteria group bacterium]|nr:helix-turn-helix domain-containing protein [Patescibacteria group bacterium]
MDISITEMQYPLNFREKDAKVLGTFLMHRQSVQLVGMKRVGISNFLRFFLYHKDIRRQYLPQDGKNLFIPVDLNNLIEREIFPFWRLTFKRIVDAVEHSVVDAKIKQKINDLFVSSIQSGDVFLTFDGVRTALVELVNAQIYPTIFLLRFDRLKTAASLDFLNNLQSLQDAANQKLSYVFTSYRELDVLVPDVFSKQTVAAFVGTMYMKPSHDKDTDIMFDTIAEKYDLSVPLSLRQLLIDLSGGHAQYLQLSLVVLHEMSQRKKVVNEDDVVVAIESDERVALQSEELWESLTRSEQDIAKKIHEGKRISEEEREVGKYLWNSGFVQEKTTLLTLFSPLFDAYVENVGKKKAEKSETVEFSKKEHMLFELLKKFLNQIVDREKIVEIVWPEYKEYGVSDWSVDRLVARVRGKLKKMGNMEIVTIRTRGYKLTEK